MQLSEPKQHQKAEPDKGPQDKRVSPPLRPNLPDQRIHSRHLTSGSNNTPINTGQRLALKPEVLVDGVCLAQDAVYHIMALVDPTPLLEHIVGFGGGGIRRPVGIDIGADISE